LLCFFVCSLSSVTIFWHSLLYTLLLGTLFFLLFRAILLCPLEASLFSAQSLLSAFLL
jgi:hypothetical protein